jgi:hypothetical protein
MRKALRISVLIMALAFSVSAGEIQNGVVSTPPPPPAMAGEIQNGVASAGDMQNGVASTSQPDTPTQAIESTATEAFLSLLQSILTLF